MMRIMLRLSFIAVSIFVSFSSAFADTAEKPAFTGLYFGIGSGFYLPQATSKISLSTAGQTINASTKNDPLAFSSLWSVGHLWPLAHDWRIGAEFQWRILGGMSSHNHNNYQIGGANIYDLERDVSWSMQYAEDLVLGKVLTPSFFFFTKLGIASEAMETHATVVSDSYDPAPINHYGEMHLGGNVGIGASWLLAKQTAFTVEYADTFYQATNNKTDTIKPIPGPPGAPTTPLIVKQNNLLSNTQTILLSLAYFF